MIHAITEPAGLSDALELKLQRAEALVAELEANIQGITAYLKSGQLQAAANRLDRIIGSSEAHELSSR
ncbi:hypothetical protein [Variovorax sp. Root411]|uniref:hypothetical protein n=1 Tax=Variovorax sp. Root411 TaxID=1736530 RepID=UPI0012F885D7|nr:hypothetical protein [Variovorax sp. Root411]